MLVWRSGFDPLANQVHPGVAKNDAVAGVDEGGIAWDNAQVWHDEGFEVLDPNVASRHPRKVSMDGKRCRERKDVFLEAEIIYIRAPKGLLTCGSGGREE